jgi:hypothetical protein
VTPWFLPLGEAVEKGVETEQESAFVIGVLGEARRFDDERQVTDVELRQGGCRSGTASLAELGGAGLGHGVADHENAEDVDHVECLREREARFGEHMKAVFDRLERLRGHRRAGEQQGQDPGMAQQGRAQRLRVAAQEPVPGQPVGGGRGGGAVLQDPLDQPV